MKDKPNGFTRAHRVKKNRDFLRLYRTGHKHYGRSFSLFTLPAAGTVCRLGISIPKRYGGAVFRNHYKRIVREMFRHAKNSLGAPCDLILSMVRRPPDNAAARKDLERLFQWLLSRNGSAPSSAGLSQP